MHSLFEIQHLSYAYHTMQGEQEKRAKAQEEAENAEK